jgi:hypothetical protein
MTRDPKIFEEEHVTLHHAAYNRENKKNLLEKVNTKIRSLMNDVNLRLNWME